jgi:hypothetical protein
MVTYLATRSSAKLCREGCLSRRKDEEKLYQHCAVSGLPPFQVGKAACEAATCSGT